MSAFIKRPETARFPVLPRVRGEDLYQFHIFEFEIRRKKHKEIPNCLVIIIRKTKKRVFIILDIL